MPGASRLFALLVAVLCMFGCSSKTWITVSPTTEAPEEIRPDPSSIASLPEQSLLDLFAREFRKRQEPLRGRNEGLQLCMWEMVRRGGNGFRATVSGALEEVRRGLKEAVDTERRGRLEDDPELELLAAVRRLEGARDPLKISVSGHATLTCTFPRLPTVHVIATNDDPGQASYLYTRGGDYRSGRWARWRFEVRDEQGREMEIRERLSGIGGGMCSHDPLNPGDSFSADLDLNLYLRPLPPGRYLVRAQYADSRAISELRDLRGCIFFLSEPFTLTVEPREIRVSSEERGGIRESILRLKDAGRVKIVEGSYSPSFHTFIAPESEPGQILQRDWKAVPDLIQALTGDGPALMKAWCISLLFTITGIENPAGWEAPRGALGDYSSRKGPWSLLDASGNGGVLLAGTRETTGSNGISAEGQTEYARRWRQWSRALDVRDP